MSDAARAAAERLRTLQLGALLSEARRKLERSGALRGGVALPAARAVEEALAGLVGGRRVRQDGPRLRVRLADVDAALRGSTFGVSLLQVLEADGGPVVTRQERQGRERLRWEAQLQRILAAAEGPAARFVADALRADGPCGRWYRRAYLQDAPAAERSAVQVGRAMAALDPAPARADLLAMFAARVAGDPHAFDRDRPAGALLLATLRERDGEPPADLRDAEARAFTLARAGLETDEVSSTVLVAHLQGCGHPVIAAMAQWGGGWPLPLAEVRALAVAPQPGRAARIVENPQVFSYLVRECADQEPGRRPTLLCTGGFLSAAGLRALDALAAAGYELHYGGDFDRNGLSIALGLLRRYPGLHPWRMGAADYAEAARGPAGLDLDAADLEWLARLDGALGGTAQAMARTGRAAYQEQLAAALLGDLRPADG